MSVRRIVANLKAEEPGRLAVFYRDLLGFEVLMELGFISTLGNRAEAPVQLSLASEGGSGTDVPAISIEVDAIAPYLTRAREMGADIAYGPVDEPWGVRRFYLRDPAGTLINILSHH